MAVTEAMKVITVPAGADLSALQYTGVALGTDKAVVSATAATAPILGILMNKPTSGQAAEVCIGGLGKGKAGGSIGSGDKVTVTTGGVFIATTTDTNHYVGIAMEDAASGDIFQINVAPGMVSL